VTVAGGRGARLTDLRIEPEIGGQLAPVAEAADVADGGHERRGDGDVDAGDGHQPFDLGPGQHLGGDQLVDLRDLCVEEVDLTQAGLDGLALADGQLLLGQPVPALDPEQVRGRRAVLQTTHQHRVDLVLDPRSGADQLRAARQPLVVADARVDEHEPGHAIRERECRLERDAAAERVADQDRRQLLADQLDERELARARPELVQVERDRLEAVVQELLLRRPNARVADV
jgi:hypothetical protein